MSAVDAAVALYNVPDSKPRALHELQLALEEEAPSDWSDITKVLLNALSVHPLVLSALQCLTLCFPPLPMASLKPFVVSFAPKLLERLGDGKPVVRETARRALLSCGTALASQLPQPEAKESQSLLDKFICEQGFVSKNPRTRELCLQYLIQLRLTYPSLPLRTYVPSLLALLEDQDPSIRDQAKEGLVTLFTDPAVPDAARQDLRSQLASSKGGIRKTTVDYLLAKLAGRPDAAAPKPDPSSHASSSSSLISSKAAADLIEPVYIASPRDLEKEFAAMKPAFVDKETEHNWQDREKSINRIRGMLKANVHAEFPEPFLQGLKSLLEGISKGVRVLQGRWAGLKMPKLVSLRTTLATAACLLVSELAQNLKSDMDSLVEDLLATLIKLNAVTKRILATASDAALKDIIAHCSYSHRFAAQILASLNEKTVQSRQLASSQIKLLLETHKAEAESNRDSEIFGQALKKGIADANPLVRQNSRASFWIFEQVWPREAQMIMDHLDPASRTQLEKSKGAPDGDLAKSTTSTAGTPGKPARVSVRQMISAQRKTPRVSGASAPISSSSTAREAPQTPGNSKTDYEAMPPPKSTAPISARKPAPRNTAPSSSTRGTTRSPGSGPRPSSSASKRSSLTSNGSSSSIHRAVGSQQTTPTRPRPSTQYSKTASPRSAADHSPLAARLALLSVHDGNDGNDSTMSTSSDGLVVEEIKAQANQAEQAAARLLELADEEVPDEPSPPTYTHGRTPSLVEPSRNGLDSWWIQQANRALLSVLWGNAVEFVAVQKPADPLPLETDGDRARVLDLVKALEDGQISFEGIRQLSRLSNDTALPYPESGLASPHEAFWSESRLLVRLIEALQSFFALQHADVTLVDAALILLKDLVCNQTTLLQGYEMSLVGILLSLRKSSSKQVAAASAAILDILLSCTDPIYALSCLRTALQGFVAAESSPDLSAEAAKSFGMALKGFGGIFKRLPVEVLEEELPLSKPLIVQGLSSVFPDTRHAAVTCLVSAQSSMQDQDLLFRLMAPDLTKPQIALLTYFIAKEQP